jgi:CheY-like chemotaxis protein
MFTNTDQEGSALLEPKVRPTVLVVDDDEAAADVLCVRLAKQGFVTTTVDSGQAAINHAQEHQPDLILLDLRLPDVDGFEVCERLADEATTTGIPVIILSGMEHPDILRKSRSAGCRFYVRKPYDPNALLALIEHALDRGEF